MAFTPPGLETLIVNTVNLDAKFSIKLGRYSISKPQGIDDSSPNKKQNSLEVLFARTQENVIQCGSDRSTVLEIFEKLVNELREINRAGDEQKNHRATWFLLGALLHRYFRVLQEYDDFNKPTSYLWWSPCYVGNCRIFMGIRKALKLPEVAPSDAKKMTTAEFKKIDLAMIDKATIMTALEAFRDNMLLEDEKRLPRYKKYPHLRDDVHFEAHLNSILDKFRDDAAPILKQFKAVSFLQSLTGQINAEHEKVEQALNEWYKVFVKEHSKFWETKIEESIDFGAFINPIEEHIKKTVKDIRLQDKILDFLYAPHIKNNTGTFQHDSFLLAMKAVSSNSAAYSVVGGYSLILQSAGIKDLKFSIFQALGIEKKPEELTDKDMLDSIEFLNQFLTDNKEIELDCKFFDGKDKMLTKLTQTQEKLIAKVKDAKEAVTQSPLLV